LGAREMPTLFFIIRNNGKASKTLLTQFKQELFIKPHASLFTTAKSLMEQLEC
jgi:hypothetical protein